MRTKLVEVLALAAALAGGGAVEAGPLLYSTDVATDELVTIDAATGQVSVIGALGRNAVDIDLTNLNGVLYGVNSIFGAQRAELLQINTTTGAATYLGDLFRGADRVTQAEGLTGRNGKLFASFTLAPGGTTSDRFGELSLLGAITNDSNEGFDSDGLATDAAGQVFGIDGEPQLVMASVHKIQPSLAVGAYATTGIGDPTDIEFAGGSLFAIPFNSLKLHTVNSGNGALTGTVDLDRPGSYLGLAVPEPTALALALVGAGLLALHRRRMKRPILDFAIRGRRQ